MFEKKVNTNSRMEMIDFLVNHFRYNTMNSWNCSTSYANNVKLYNLDIPKELEDKAFDVICSEVNMYEFWEDVNWLIEEFKNETGYDAGFNGRSGGYIVMYDTEWKYENGKRKLVTYPGRSIDDYNEEDFEEQDTEWLIERVKLVQRFDRLCDDILETFIYYLKNYEVVEEDYTVVKTRKVLQEAI